MKQFVILALAVACLAIAAVETAHAFSNYSAVINANGTTLRGSGVTNSTRAATGRYNVRFARDVSGCSFIASVMSTSRGSASALAHPNATGQFIQVYTFGPSGAAANQNFTLMVSCTPELVVRRIDVMVSDGSTSGVSKACEPGETIIGGSADFAVAVSDSTAVSRPDNTGAVPADGETFTSWRATGRNPSGGSGTTAMRVFVLCAR